MSESFLTAGFLSLSGGLQDAYTYMSRGKVFANAQTGNIVLDVYKRQYYSLFPSYPIHLLQICMTLNSYTYP